MPGGVLRTDGRLDTHRRKKEVWEIPKLLHTSSETALVHRLKCELRHWWQSALPAYVQSAQPCALPGKTHICSAKHGEAVPRAWLVSVLEERRTAVPEPELEPHRNSRLWQQGLKRHLGKKLQRWRQVDAYWATGRCTVELGPARFGSGFANRRCPYS